MLLRVLAMQRASRRDEDAGRLCVDQRDRAVLHLGGRIALGVDVADLLELQRPFERDREMQVAAEVEHALCRRDTLGGSSINGSVFKTSPSRAGTDSIASTTARPSVNESCRRRPR